MTRDPVGRRSWQATCSVATAKRRAAMLADARIFFASRNIMEVETPVLSSTAVSDPNIECIGVALRMDKGAPKFLHSSPEYCMKRLLCDGYPDIYSICKVFRDSECGNRHQPEFTMAEWYRIGFGLQDMIAETCDFIVELIDEECLPKTADSMSYSQAFMELAGIDPFAAPCNVLADTAQADDRLRKVLGDNRDQWLDLLMSRTIAAQFPGDRLTVIHHYPASQAALSRICPDDSDCADRFEVFFGDLELANGYVELLDAKSQQNRWENQQELRRRNGQTLVSPDQQLLDALRSGMPPCSGVAVGFDRLVMINERISDIACVQTFAFDRQ